LLTIVIASYNEYVNFRLNLVFPRNSLFFLTDVVNIILTITVHWNGWVFLVPALVWLYLKKAIGELLILYFIASVFFGVLDTILSFNSVDGAIILKGIIFYDCVFGVILLFAVMPRALTGFKK